MVLEKSSTMVKKKGLKPSCDVVENGLQMSQCINSKIKEDLCMLMGKWCLCCLDKGQTVQIVSLICEED